MEFTLDIDDGGRFVARLSADGHKTRLVTSSLLPAVADLLAAVEDARDTGYGECLWQEQGGDYRWMFRAAGERLTVVALWSTGTLTGWEHVFRGDCDLDWFASRVREGLARHGLSA
jgi:uncharacterized protein YegP (UPF0339 family)